jgi:hypothetical protein
MTDPAHSRPAAIARPRADRHRDAHPGGGPRQGHAAARRGRARRARPGCTSSSSAASRSSYRAGRTGRCRSWCSGCAASARSATTWPPRRPWTRSSAQTALTPTAEKVRRLMHYGQILQSHALHFFYLSSPDLLFGFDSESPGATSWAWRRRTPSWRAAACCCAVRPGSDPGHRRQAHSWHRLGARRREPLRAAGRARALRAGVPAGSSAGAAKPCTWCDACSRRTWSCTGSSPASRRTGCAWCGPTARWTSTTAACARATRTAGRCSTTWTTRRYWEQILEEVKPWSYMKFPFLRVLGPAHGWYRVGPLTRVTQLRLHPLGATPSRSAASSSSFDGGSAARATLGFPLGADDRDAARRRGHRGAARRRRHLRRRPHGQGERERAGWACSRPPAARSFTTTASMNATRWCAPT